MADQFSKLNGGEFLGLCGILLGLIAVVGGITIGMSTLVAIYKRRTLLDEMEATLKMEIAQLRGDLTRASVAEVMQGQGGDRFARGNPVFLPPVENRR